MPTWPSLNLTLGFSGKNLCEVNDLYLFKGYRATKFGCQQSQVCPGPRLCIDLEKNKIKTDYPTFYCPVNWQNHIGYVSTGAGQLGKGSCCSSELCILSTWHWKDSPEIAQGELNQQRCPGDICGAIMVFSSSSCEWWLSLASYLWSLISSSLSPLRGSKQNLVLTASSTDP